jgi:isoamylase
MTAAIEASVDRVDSFPTQQVNGYDVRPGRTEPFGATVVPGGGVNFSIYSSSAHAVTLVLFEQGGRDPLVELPIPAKFRIGSVWSMVVFGLDYENVEYGYRVYGPEQQDFRDRFDHNQVLADPYARAFSGRDVWGEDPDRSKPYPYRSRLTYEDFDWEDDQPLRIPSTDLVVYELHVRGFTRDPSSGVSQPGTYAGLVEKIPYLKSLGVNCVELMPVFEFDEFENSHINEETGERLYNFWGYSTVGFYAPKAGYAATGAFGMQRDEFKNMVKQFHRAGIEVALDVVFNHTAEGNENGPTIHFRGMDNRTYYMLTPEGYYYNFSGTGNTLNCNSPVVREYVLSCLRFWASEYHVDGFRFDLAAILGRGTDGAPLENPPLLESMAFDPVLTDCLLIAEAWDAGGLYQVGSFPNYRRWSEWNGKFRDTVRKFLKGDGDVGDLATRMVGSPDLYWARGTCSSINFITCHDGFSLADMVSYNDKHNEANGEDNRDGANDNNSWNCGAEGKTDDPEINTLRMRQMKNAMVLLLTSQGVPMILSGDEVGRSQQGNNNAYCHDSVLTWMDWNLVDENAELLNFTRNLIAFRKKHPSLRDGHHPRGDDPVGCGYPDVSWHGTRAWQPDWSESSRVIAVMRNGHNLDGDDSHVYIGANSHWEAHEMELPELPEGMRWHRFVDTHAPGAQAITVPGQEVLLDNQHSVTLGPRSTVILLGSRPLSD